MTVMGDMKCMQIIHGYFYVSFVANNSIVNSFQLYRCVVKVQYLHINRKLTATKSTTLFKLNHFKGDSKKHTFYVWKKNWKKLKYMLFVSQIHSSPHVVTKSMNFSDILLVFFLFWTFCSFISSSYSIFCLFFYIFLQSFHIYKIHCRVWSTRSLCYFYLWIYETCYTIFVAAKINCRKRQSLHSS